MSAELGCKYVTLGYREAVVPKCNKFDQVIAYNVVSKVTVKNQSYGGLARTSIATPNLYANVL